MTSVKLTSLVDLPITEPYGLASVVHLPVDAGRASISVVRPSGTILCLVLADLSAVIVSVFLASFLRNWVIGNEAAPILGLTLSAAFFTFCSFIGARLYPGVGESPVDELRRTVLATTLSFLCLGASTFVSHDLLQSRLVVLLAYLFSSVLVPLARSATRACFASRPWWGCPVVIIGMGFTGKHVLQTLRDHPESGLKPVAILDDDPSTYEAYRAELVTGPPAMCTELTRSGRISYGIVCKPDLSKTELFELLDRYGHCFSEVLIIPDLIGMASLGVSVRECGGIIGLEITHCLFRPFSRFAKRALDLVTTLALAPFIGPLVALAVILIKLESRGPVFYRDVRIGCGGQKFTAWKLRSMVVNGGETLEAYLKDHPEEGLAWHTTQKLKKDPRITRVGRIIRRTSIDELPQFWNVLRGQMSVVGPRPFLPNQTKMYGKSYELYKRVRPGITGLWQISGRNHLSFEERARLDDYEIRNWSVWFDLYIMSRTIMAVLTAKGAY